MDIATLNNGVPDEDVHIRSDGAAAAIARTITEENKKHAPPFTPRLLTTPSWSLPPGLFCYRIDMYRVLVGGALTDGGSVVEWLCKLFRWSSSDFQLLCEQEVSDLVDRQYAEAAESAITVADDTSRDMCMHSTNETTEEIMETDAGRHRRCRQQLATTCVPFWSGERSTGYRFNATGCLFGITRETTAEQIVLSCITGIVLRLLAIVELLNAVVVAIELDAGMQIATCVKMPTKQDTRSNKETRPTKRAEKKTPLIMVSGKALERNTLWRQLISDSTAMEVVMDPTTKEGTSRGMARLVGIEIVVDDDAEKNRRRRIHREEAISYTVEDARAGSPSGSVAIHPRREGRDYWDHAKYSQNTVIGALSPLFE